MDPLKHVLNAIRLKPELFQRRRLQGMWRCSALNVAAYHLVEQGSCDLWLNEVAPLPLTTGDLVVITNTKQYQLTAANSTDETLLIHGEFRSEANIVYPLFSLLPPLIYIPNQQGQPIYWLAAALQGIASEAQGQRPGYDAVISRLMDILFIMVMRSWIDQHTQGDGGWLGALYDPQLGKSMSAIHAQPHQVWSVEGLAQVALMSRSMFAERFTTMVGEPPMKYLTRWRIQLATTWLAEDTSLTVEQIAYRIGYASPFAFSKAFKRLTGISPSEYRKTH